MQRTRRSRQGSEVSRSQVAERGHGELLWQREQQARPGAFDRPTADAHPSHHRSLLRAEAVPPLAD
eukprot:scaffold17146_cov110-Isochrysis_galbana.AAC.5